MLLLLSVRPERFRYAWTSEIEETLDPVSSASGVESWSSARSVEPAPSTLRAQSPSSPSSVDSASSTPRAQSSSSGSAWTWPDSSQTDHADGHEQIRVPTFSTQYGDGRAPMMEEQASLRGKKEKYLLQERRFERPGTLLKTSFPGRPAGT